MLLPPQSVLSENTIRPYRCDWNRFVQWCRARRLSALPAEAETVRLFAAALARTHRIASIVPRVDVITQRQRDYGAWAPAARKSPAVRNELCAIRRDQSKRPTAKRQFTIEELRKMVSRLPRRRSGCATALCSLSSSLEASGAANSPRSILPT